MCKDKGVFQLVGTCGLANDRSSTRRLVTRRSVLSAVSRGSIIAEARIRRIRQEIAAGTYLTDEKLDRAIAALGEALVEGPHLVRRRAAV